MSFPQYYRLLGVSPSATGDQIRQAYKKESLKTHPDRLPPTASLKEKKLATEKFQAVADAYYVLSDASRRREYDDLLSSRSSSGGFSSGAGTSSSRRTQPPGGFDEFGDAEFEFDPADQEKASSNFFESFSGFFKGATGAGAGAAGAGMGQRPDANDVFGDVFEEMLAPEVANRRPFWSYTAGAAGAVLGYVVANVPGALAGGVAGNRLGAIRDAKGKSVAAVFSQLGGAQKAEILRALAFKVLGSMGTS